MDLFHHYLQIIILGVVEGVTEFLPISSTGHLLIAEHLLKSAQPEVFNVVIQAGAILAVVFVYWGKLVDLFGSLDRPSSRSYVQKLFVAFCLTGGVGYALTHHYHLKLPDTLFPVAWATLIGGFVILLIEFLAKNLYPHEDVSWREAILIGLAQIAAGIFPGTSRSGVTIVTGLAMGMKRPTATEFSFLVGIPTMFAASALEMAKYHKELTSANHQLLIDITVGFFVSAIVAFFVIKWLLRFVQSHTFNGFAIYRIILGGVLLGALYTHAIPDVGASEMDVAKPVPSEVTPAPVVAPAPETNAAPVAPVAPTTNADFTPALPVAPDHVINATTNIIDTSSDSTTTILAPLGTNTPSAAIPAQPVNGTVVTPANRNQSVSDTHKIKLPKGWTLITNQTTPPVPSAPSNVPAQ